MHRLDTADATGRPMVLTTEHDWVLVPDVVVELAPRHGAPFTVHLTGPAGGTWSGTGGEELTVDAVLFARMLSGRASGSGLPAVGVTF
jgi:hypothetical protein